MSIESKTRKTPNTSKPLVPHAEQAAREFMNNFIGRLRENAASFGVNHETLSSLAARIEAFNQALELANTPSTRTTVTIREKRRAQTEATDAVSEIARIIKVNPQVTDAQRATLGLSPRKRATRVSKINKITTRPELEIVSIENGGHLLRSSERPDPRCHLLLFAAVGDKPVTDPNEARFVGVYSHTRISTSFPFDDAHRYVTYFVRWGAMNNIVGPWSQPLIATLAFAAPDVAKKTLKLAHAA